MPILTIVTINLNNASGLERTIQSVISQSIDDIEYIIIDGASTDGSLDIICRYGAFISKWSSRPDCGIYHAMNRGITLSTGEYIMFLNSGDYLVRPDVISDLLKSGQSADVIYGNIAILQNNTVREICSPSNIYYSFRYQHNLPPQPATLVKRYLYYKHGGFDQTYQLIADVVLFSNIFSSNLVTRVCHPIIVTLFDTGGVSSLRQSQKRIFLERLRYLAVHHPCYLLGFFNATLPFRVFPVHPHALLDYRPSFRVYASSVFQCLRKKMSMLL